MYFSVIFVCVTSLDTAHLAVELCILAGTTWILIDPLVFTHRMVDLNFFKPRLEYCMQIQFQGDF